MNPPSIPPIHKAALWFALLFLLAPAACSPPPEGRETLDVNGLIRENRLEEASDIVAKALANNPRDPALLYNQAAIHRHMGELLEARELAGRAMRHAGGDGGDIRLLQAELALDFGAVDEAWQHYQALDDSTRNSPRGLLVYGLILSNRKDWLQAAAVLRSSLDRGGETPAKLAALAFAQLKSGKPEEAKTLLNRAEQSADGSPSALRQIAECHLAMANATRAREIAAELANRGPNDARVWSLLGRAEMILLRFGEAESAFTRALASPNATPWTTVEYAMMLFAARREDEALAKASEAETQLRERGRPAEDPSLFNLLATLYARKGQWLLAHQYLERSFRIDPNQAKVRELMNSLNENAAAGG